MASSALLNYPERNQGIIATRTPGDINISFAVALQLNFLLEVAILAVRLIPYLNIYLCFTETAERSR
jgi:hypothetical protein